MKLIKCLPPKQELKQTGEPTKVKGHTFIGYVDKNGNCFEHDTTANQWYRLIEA